MTAKIQNFIHWHEGMLLSPHHFQQSDSYLQQMFSVFGTSGNAFCYGIHEISVDTSALSSGVIRILKARGIFQDGYYFDYDAMRDRPLEKNLTEYFSAHTAPVKVYLAIPIRKIGENELGGDMARYYPDELTNVNDENTGENLINIPILKPKIRLLTAEEIDARYTSFPVFEAEKAVDGGVVGTKFIPPYITVDEHSKISEVCRDIAQAIRSKVSYFADRKDNYAGVVTDESMACLRILIQAALPLEAIIKINSLQPFEIYKCLLHSAAHIISVNPTQLIPLLPKYDHVDLFGTFDSLQKYVQNILEKMKQKYEVVRFEKEGNTFKLQMKKEWLSVGDEIAIGIQKAFSATEDETLHWIAGVQIASESMLGMIKDRRILGAERCIMERGAYITQPVGMTILAVKIKNAYIKDSEKLCISNPSNVGVPEEVILYAER
ncbi:MAG: type VI secretion system baseplate subunit TssK [Holosporaceae bacterium]|jgi:type VI secretion system protein ImpJ|nr:type VI secretion system baseplate subunit TssK [Holosporaceae bacterium]